MIEHFGTTMPADAASYRVIADEIGWQQYGGVADCLFALREKGHVRSVGGTPAKPERWEVVA